MNATLKTLASHMRQIQSHTESLDAELFPLLTEGEAIYNLAAHIGDTALEARVRQLGYRVAGISTYLESLARLAADLAVEVENATPTPPREEQPVAVTPPPANNLGGQVAPAHWNQDDSALAEIAAELDIDGVLAATVPTIGTEASHLGTRERMERAFRPPGEDVSEP